MVFIEICSFWHCCWFINTFLFAFDRAACNFTFDSNMHVSKFNVITKVLVTTTMVKWENSDSVLFSQVLTLCKYQKSISILHKMCQIISCFSFSQSLHTMHFPVEVLSSINELPLLCVHETHNILQKPAFLLLLLSEISEPAISHISDLVNNEKPHFLSVYLALHLQNAWSSVPQCLWSPNSERW